MTAPILWLAALVWLSATPQAQPSAPAAKPISFQFDASADHDRVDAAGKPLVTKYVVEFYLNGAGAPVRVVDLGKPALVKGAVSAQVDVNGLAPGDYTISVSAVGPSGRSAGAASMRIRINADGRRKTIEAGEEAGPSPHDGHGPASPAPGQPPAAAPPRAPDESAPPPNTPPAKGGFWKKFYGKIVG